MFEGRRGKEIRGKESVEDSANGDVFLLVDMFGRSIRRTFSMAKASQFRIDIKAERGSTVHKG